jgi:acetyltransferase-like isoleucine patch superfamily enzyme
MAGAKVGSRCNICEHVFVETGAIIGDGVTVKNSVSIWDKVTLEDDVFVGPGVCFTNDKSPRAFLKKSKASWLPTTVRRRASIGAGAVILCGIEIGEYALVGAGALVATSVPRRALVLGNPARIAAYVCDCLETKVSKADFDAGRGRKCPKCGVDPTKA